MRLASPFLRTRRAIACALLGAALGATASLAEEIPVSSSVVSATIYPDAAAVTRAALFDAPVGRHVLLIEDAPDALDPSSLRISGSAGGGGAFQILSAERGLVARPPSPEENATREEIEDEIEDAEWRLRAAEDAVALAEERLDYVRAFRAATATAPQETDGGAALIGARGDWGAAWSDLAAEAQSAAADKRIAERRVVEIAEEIDELLRLLAEVGPGAPDKTVLKVAIEVDAEVADGRLDIAYLTRGARWRPLYDMRLAPPEPGAAADKRSLRVVRRAAISQSTGEDWDGVRLVLSTTRPSGRLEGRVPDPFIATIWTPQLLGGSLSAGAATADAAEELRLDDGVAQTKSRRDRAMSDTRSEAPPEPAPASESAATAEFDGETIVYALDARQDVAGDGSTSFALIGEDDAEATIEARVAPAIDETAYLVAIATFDAPLPPGAASIFRGDAYLGQTRIRSVAAGDKAELPFGQIEGLKTSYAVVERLRGEEGVFSTSTTNRERFSVNIENVSAVEWPVVVFAATPVTEDEKIEISLVTPTTPDETTVLGRRGVVAWRFLLAPAAERDIAFGWNIAWPEGEQVIFGSE